jgi:hypothetical protein
MVTDASAVSGTHDVTIAGVDFLFVVSKTYPDIGVAFMTATGTPPAGGPTATPFKIADAGSLQLGQTLLGLYGEKQDRVGMTILSSASKLATLKSGDKSITVRTIDTGLDVPTPGAPLVTVFGDLAGISTDVSRISAKGSYVAMSDIMNAIAAGQVKGDATTTVAVQ